jgi:hypothetical protein
VVESVPEVASRRPNSFRQIVRILEQRMYLLRFCSPYIKSDLAATDRTHFNSER